MTLLAGINHAAFLTRDLDRLLDFYTEVFGVEVIFSEAAPAFRHAMLRLGDGAVLHPAELQEDSPHAEGIPEMFRRGHLDHLGLNVSSHDAFMEVRQRLLARGASDGAISDLGPQWCMWFVDPDGMRAEVCWVRDPELRGFHAPTPLALD